MKKLLLILVVLIFTGSASATILNFTPDSTKTWVGYINIYDKSDNFQFSFMESGHTTASANWAAGHSLPLTLSPNTRLYDDNILDPLWVDQVSLEATRISEFRYYQELVGNVGDTVNLSYSTTMKDLPAGYTAVAFVEVMDAWGTWSITQFQTKDLVVGTNDSISFIVEDAGFGSELILAGFAIRGPYVSSLDPVALTGVTLIPEPATLFLLSLGSLMLRRKY